MRRIKIVSFLAIATLTLFAFAQTAFAVEQERCFVRKYQPLLCGALTSGEVNCTQEVSSYVEGAETNLVCDVYFNGTAANEDPGVLKTLVVYQNPAITDKDEWFPIDGEKLFTMIDSDKCYWKPGDEGKNDIRFDSTLATLPYTGYGNKKGAVIELEETLILKDNTAFNSCDHLKSGCTTIPLVIKMKAGTETKEFVNKLATTDDPCAVRIGNSSNLSNITFEGFPFNAICIDGSNNTLDKITIKHSYDGIYIKSGSNNKITEVGYAFDTKPDPLKESSIIEYNKDTLVNNESPQPELLIVKSLKGKTANGVYTSVDIEYYSDNISSSSSPILTKQLKTDLDDKCSQVLTTRSDGKVTELADYTLTNISKPKYYVVRIPNTAADRMDVYGVTARVKGVDGYKSVGKIKDYFGCSKFVTGDTYIYALVDYQYSDAADAVDATGISVLAYSGSSTREFSHVALLDRDGDVDGVLRSCEEKLAIDKSPSEMLMKLYFANNMKGLFSDEQSIAAFGENYVLPASDADLTTFPYYKKGNACTIEKYLLGEDCDGHVNTITSKELGKCFIDIDQDGLDDLGEDPCVGHIYQKKTDLLPDKIDSDKDGICDSWETETVMVKGVEKTVPHYVRESVEAFWELIKIILGEVFDSGSTGGGNVGPTIGGEVGDNCTSDSSCAEGKVCKSGECELKKCTDDIDTCSVIQKCNESSGDCEPKPCVDDDAICNDPDSTVNICDPDTKTCKVRPQCTEDSECGEGRVCNNSQKCEDKPVLVCEYGSTDGINCNAPPAECPNGTNTDGTCADIIVDPPIIGPTIIKTPDGECVPDIFGECGDTGIAGPEGKKSGCSITATAGVDSILPYLILLGVVGIIRRKTTA